MVDGVSVPMVEIENIASHKGCVTLPACRSPGNGLPCRYRRNLGVFSPARPAPDALWAVGCLDTAEHVSKTVQEALE